MFHRINTIHQSLLIPPPNLQFCFNSLLLFSSYSRSNSLLVPFPLFQKWLSLIIPFCSCTTKSPFFESDLSVCRHAIVSLLRKQIKTVLTLYPAFAISLFLQHIIFLRELCYPMMCRFGHLIFISRFIPSMMWHISLKKNTVLINTFRISNF